MSEEEFDIVEEALVELSYELMPEDADDEKIDNFTEELFKTISEMIIDEEIEEMPSDESSEEEKKKWLSDSIHKIKERINADKNTSNSDR